MAKVPIVRAVLAGLIVAGSASGQEVRLDVSRDTWLSNVGAEADGSNGGASKLKAKSIQEMTLLDVDPRPLRGRVVESASLHVRISGDRFLRRVTVGTVGAAWFEGTAANYEQQAGASTHNHARHPDVPWTLDGGDLCRVILGQGGSAWASNEASKPDAQGWQHVPIDPKIVALRASGVGEGFVVFDDTGSEWERKGEAFRYDLFPNRFFSSREQNRSSAPYLTVRLGKDDRRPPSAPGNLTIEAGELAAGEAIASWSTPVDEGAAGTVGFFATVEGKEVPRAMIPVAGIAGSRNRMSIRDLGLAPGSTVRLAVRAVDGAGNVGPAVEVRGRVSDRRPRPLPGIENSPGVGDVPLPRIAGVEVAVVDELDKVDPVRGRLIPEAPTGYLAANHVWNASEKRIRLQAAKNESVAFQVLIRGKADVVPSLEFPGDGPIKPVVEFGRYEPIRSKGGWRADPIVPLSMPKRSIPEMASRSVHVEVYVPHEMEAGEHGGRLMLKSGGESLSMEVVLTVRDFTLADRLSFLPEMNGYDLPRNEIAYYRLAHKHRTALNRVPYHHDGRVSDGCAPRWDGKTLDWAAYDRRFGPLLDGSAFADMPRRGVPVDVFYLPIFENWPSPMEGNYNGEYWADKAFPESYRRDLVSASRQFAEHAASKGWNDTLLECFFNGKVDFKRRGWSRGTSPWLLDEPANFQDYWALRFFGLAFHEGVALAPPSRSRLVFRADISRPQWQRDVLDGILDVNIVGGAFRPYRRMVLDRKAANGEIVLEYGSANSLDDPDTQAVSWSLDAWSLGADGVLPWQTIGDEKSWDEADSLSLFYPSLSGGGAPIPSIRLKAFRRGQQDVEYWTLYGLETKEPRWAMGETLRAALKLDAERHASGEDAGVLLYRKIRPEDLAALRDRIGRALSEMHPRPRRQLVDFRPPTRRGP